MNCVLEGQIRRIIQCCLLDHLGRLSYRPGMRHDEINLQAEQLLYQGGEAVRLILVKHRLSGTGALANLGPTPLSI